MKKFKGILESYNFKADREGIFKNINGDKYYITNFSQIQFMYNIKDYKSKTHIRRIKIENHIFDLRPEELLNLNAFKKILLAVNNYRFLGNKYDFDIFIGIILALDNSKIVYSLLGFGRVADDVYNLGNIIYTENTIYPFRDVIWSGKKGYFLQHTDRISIDANSYSLTEIYNKFNSVIGSYSLTVLSFAVAGIFFSSITNYMSSFPILHLTGKKGIGKSSLSYLILKFFGMDNNWGTVNCDSTSTKIGIEEKTQNFNNIPLVLNEINKSYYPMLKSRFDLQGSTKAANFKKMKTEERTVKGPIITISVDIPDNDQVSSRFVIIDYEKVNKDKAAFDQLSRESPKFSGFILNVLQRVSPEDIIM